jgi:hypothetical protein
MVSLVQGHNSLGLGKLATEVPFSHHANSTIVCRISGKIMDEDNMPMAFPNGYVYSREVGVSLSFQILCDCFAGFGRNGSEE